MGILRSELMRHGTLILPIDRARDFIDLVGEKTNIQIEDMNARSLHRPYKRYVQRVEEMERIIRFLSDELKGFPEKRIVKTELDVFLANSTSYKLDEVESRLKRINADFVEFRDHSRELMSKRNAGLEELFVVRTANAQFGQRSLGGLGGRSVGKGMAVELDDCDDDDFNFEESSLLNSASAAETAFSNVAGVIPQDEQDRFARTLFRATRGNTFTHFQQVPEAMQDPQSGKFVAKAVFVVYFQDTRGGLSVSAMAQKVIKICSSFGVNTYKWPTNREVAEERTTSIKAHIADCDRLLTAQRGFMTEVVQALVERPRRGASSLIEEWRRFCLKEKGIYAQLNFFEGQTNLRANCWYPTAEEDQIRALLIQYSARSSGAMLVSDRHPPRKSPPTYIRLNEFTTATQTLINLYGFPRYQEINPMPLSLVSFPFLFGVMYGDIGHGMLLFLFGLCLVWKAELVKQVSLLYDGRYMIAMMGFFAIYAGLLYNDCFSVGLDLFGSRWTASESENAGIKVHTFQPQFDAKNTGGAGPYPFGLDPAWHGASNELVYVNSLKMKLSVILGVAQMTSGLVLRFMNAKYEANTVDFWCECVPMMVFMMCFFGFMDYMILYKWVTAMDNPPSIINSLIAMGMGQKDPNPMFGDDLPKQLMLLTVLTVPWMLILKPFILYRRMQEAHGPGGGHSIGRAVSLDDDEEKLDSDDEETHEGFSDIVIHQVIETIEYVLGTVSHTASYLRLWALSLAHQQLSFVFFQKTILSGMGASFPLNVIGIYITFALWFMITLGVLMGMDVMECVLHVLRLHWIEFQSKFYKADGYLFIPYRHRDVCDDSEGGF